MLTVTSKDSFFTGLDFVCKAIDTKHYNPSLKLLHVKDQFGLYNIIEGTNGYILHQFQVKGFLNPGLYKVLKVTKKEIWLEPDTEGRTYPDTEQVIPKDEPNKTLSIYWDDLSDKVTADTEYSKLVRSMDENITLKFDYFSRLSGHEWKVDIYGKHTPVVFTNEVLKALLMPIRIL